MTVPSRSWPFFRSLPGSSGCPPSSARGQRLPPLSRGDPARPRITSSARPRRPHPRFDVSAGRHRPRLSLLQPLPGIPRACSRLPGLPCSSGNISSTRSIAAFIRPLVRGSEGSTSISTSRSSTGRSTARPPRPGGREGVERPPERTCQGLRPRLSPGRGRLPGGPPDVSRKMPTCVSLITFLPLAGAVLLVFLRRSGRTVRPVALARRS